MSKAAIRHVSVRVPWHDSAWNGRVCRDARSNSACLALKRTSKYRDDAFEADHPGLCFSEANKKPPCLAERGTFLSPKAFELETVLNYSTWIKEHKHILPGYVHVPAWGGVLTPYRWMLREHAFEIAAGYGLDVSHSREPQKGSAPAQIVDTAWVQNWTNQEALLEAFKDQLSPAESLVFFYAKETPLTESPNRQIVAVAKLGDVGKISEYPYEGGSANGRIQSMIWERPFQHSLRPHPDEEVGGWAGGVVLPYHELLERAATDADLVLADYVAEVPTEAREQFLYATEHVTHGSAITALLAVRKALERVETVLAGPWQRYIDWIDTEMSALWRMQGPTPGLGSALSCFDKNFNGTLFAHALAAELDDAADPWPIVHAIFGGKRDAPPNAPKITKTQRLRWAFLMRDPKVDHLLRLLSCFELTKDQAREAFNSSDVDAILENPYVLFERSRTQLKPISLTTIDRSLYPSDPSLPKPPLPDTVDLALDEADEPFRLRAIAIELLEKRADAGDTLASGARLAADVETLPLGRSATLDATSLKVLETAFSPEVIVSEADQETFAQLARYDLAKRIISRHVETRLESISAASTVDWTAALEQALAGKPGSGEEETYARAEKVRALQKLERSPLAVLTGPAGTGKTTLLKAFLDQAQVVGQDVLLLAPTGKARVRLGQQTERADQAQTLAQFLREHGRYDEVTQRYIIKDDGTTAPVSTCVVDECSMLTEDQLAALCSVLPLNARLLLVGDPHQLPPIGAGRPFVDIIERLRVANALESSGDTGSAVTESVALSELTISRRQSGNSIVPALSLPDVQLANIFSGRSLPPGEDEVIAQAATPVSSDRLKFVSWDTPATLRQRILDVLKQELPGGDVDLERAVDTSFAGESEGEHIYFNWGCGKNAENWQILSAHKNQASGSSEINRLVKQAARRNRLEFARTKKKGWHVIAPRGADQITYGDKVICLRNHRPYRYDYEQEQRSKGYLANGEVGIVTGDTGEGKLFATEVEFASQKGMIYDFKEEAFSEEGSPYLELAYAVTVHKAQGSEFGSVILVIPERSQLLSREMLYTALTRQKDRVWVLHQGPFRQYLKLRSDFFSETKRRSTNLFGTPHMYEAVVTGDGGPRRGWLAQQLIHATRGGILVSSKSELVIADALFELQQKGLLGYSFEKPLTHKGETRWPDFTIERGMETWYWEHCGLLHQPEYAQRWAKKLQWYLDQGISRWSDDNPSGRLIVTEDSPEGGLDSGSIHVLANRLFA